MPRRPREGVDVKLICYFNLGARWGGWSASRFGRYTPGKDQVPIVLEAGLGPRTGLGGYGKISLPTGDLITVPSSP
jgi:hypothetical protein